MPTLAPDSLTALDFLLDSGNGEGDFWTGAPVPALPVQAELPTDLLLRQLPEPEASLGGLGFVDFLAPLYTVFAESPDES